MPTTKKNASKKQVPVKPKAMLTSRIRSVVKSKGVILNNDLLKVAGLDTNADIVLAATAGTITIVQAKSRVNTDLSTWDRQFKKARQAGAEPNEDLFEGLANKFDEEGWVP